MRNLHDERFHRFPKEKHISKHTQAELAVAWLHSENLACGWVDAGSPCTLCIMWWTKWHQYLTENDEDMHSRDFLHQELLIDVITLVYGCSVVKRDSSNINLRSQLFHHTITSLITSKTTTLVA